MLVIEGIDLLFMWAAFPTLVLGFLFELMFVIFYIPSALLVDILYWMTNLRINFLDWGQFG